jgi:hypothetical protein
LCRLVFTARDSHIMGERLSKIASATSRSIFRLLLASTMILMLTSRETAGAQSSILPNGMSASIFVGTIGALPFSQSARFGLASSTLARPHLNPSGKPCVTIQPISHAQIMNKNIYDHSLLISNECSQTIRLSVCYYHVQNCSMISIAGYARKLELFGIFPEKEFRIEYREYLD